MPKSNRVIAQATRCQLITGSYEKSSRSCDCESTLCCKITEDDRKDLSDNLKVQNARTRNWKEFTANINKDEQNKQSSTSK